MPCGMTASVSLESRRLLPCNSWSMATTRPASVSLESRRLLRFACDGLRQHRRSASVSLESRRLLHDHDGGKGRRGKAASVSLESRRLLQNWASICADIVDPPQSLWNRGDCFLRVDVGTLDLPSRLSLFGIAATASSPSSSSPRSVTTASVSLESRRLLQTLANASP